MQPNVRIMSPHVPHSGQGEKEGRSNLVRPQSAQRENVCVESRNGGKGEGTTQGTDAHIHIGVSPFHSYHNFSHNQERDRGREGGCGERGGG